MTPDPNAKPIDFNALDEPIGVAVYGYQLTRRDVQMALFAQGDEVVDDYAAGRVSQQEAYAIARAAVKQLLQRGARRVGGTWVLQRGC